MTPSARAGFASALVVTLLCALPSRAGGGREPDGIAVWRALPGANTCPAIYDYFPDGGMRIFMCHARNGMSWTELVARAPTAPFTSGPHASTGLNLDHPRDFGHYDPAFVRWLGGFAIPEDPATVSALRPTYDAYVRPLARTSWLVRRALQADPTCRDRVKRDYSAVMERGQADGYTEAWYDFPCKDPGDLGDGNVVKTVVAWWLRRELDGSATEWDAQLARLIRAFDRDWLSAMGAPQPVGDAQPIGAAPTPPRDRLTIPKGRHSVVVTGSVRDGEPRRWTLDALPAQPITLAVTSEHRVDVHVSALGRPSIVPGGSAVFTGRLPDAPGPYVVTVQGTGPFELFVGVW